MTMTAEQYRLSLMLAIHRAQASGFHAFAAALAEMLRRETAQFSTHAGHAVG